MEIEMKGWRLSVSFTWLPPRITTTHSVEEIREFVGADSLGYLSIRGVLNALELPYEQFCFACFDGRYPDPVPYDAASRKFILEEPIPAGA